MPSPQTPLARVLYCTDFSDNAHAAFSQAVAIAAAWPGCELTLLHVLPEPDAQFWKTYMHGDSDADPSPTLPLEKLIEEDYRPLVPETITLHTAFRTGKPYAQILDFASQYDAQLIVIGRQGSSLSSLLCGSVAAKVVQKASCPVLVIPMPS